MIKKNSFWMRKINNFCSIKAGGGRGEGILTEALIPCDATRRLALT